MVKRHRVSKLYTVAKWYYEDHLNQNDIAEKLETSRASISRMLQEAQDNGIVTITVNPPVLEDSDISKRISSTYGIPNVVVVPAMANDKDTMSAVGHVAALKLTKMLNPGASLTMTWGRVIASIVDEIPANALENIEVTTLVGSIGGNKPELDGPDLARRMASALHGTYEYINAPAVMLTPKLRDQLLSTSQINQVLKKASRADVALYSIGTLNDPHSSLNRAGYITKQEQYLYRAQGGVGHLAAQIIKENGDEIPEFNARTVALSLKDIASRPHSIAVVCGASKAPALLAALKQQYMNYLIVDSRCATALLTHDEKN